MDLTYASPARDAFISNVGLITSDGPHGPNIMPAEWTFQVSYDPGLIGVSIGLKKATKENIEHSKCFGVTIAAEDQNVLSSLAGAYTGREFDKIGFLTELGFRFLTGKHIPVLLPEGGCMQAECELVSKFETGDHMVFTGKAVSIEAHPERKPIVYHRKQYWSVGMPVHKPSPEEREKMKDVAEKYRK